MKALRFFLIWVDRLASWLSFIPPALARAIVGYGFYLTGKGKLAHLDNLTAFFTELHIPHPELNAVVVANLEYYGGILLMVGFVTRFTAAALSVTMGVALATADKDHLIEAWNPESEIVPTDVTSFAYLALLLWLMFYGAGWLSVDGPLGWFMRKKVGATEEAA
jgi:putative oxidoreductase